MRNGFIDLDFETLDRLLRFKESRIIGGTVVNDATLRLYLVLDEKPDKFDDSWKILSIEDVIDTA